VTPRPARGGHPQRRLLGAREVHVAVGQPADERELQHRGEPLRAQRGITERGFEDRVEGS